MMITDLDASLTTQMYSEMLIKLPVTPQVYCRDDQIFPDVLDPDDEFCKTPVQKTASSSLKLKVDGNRAIGISQRRSFPSWSYKTP